LTVVDVASRIIDAIPLKGRESQDVVEGFEQIKKHKHIDMDKVTSIYTDPGSEFKNKDVHDYFEKQEIVIRHGMTNRHQQQGVVEYYNHLLTKALGTKMTSQTLDANEHISTWVDDLPKLVAVLNRKENLHENTDISKFFSLPTAPADKDILKEGTVVHVRLQQPKNPLTGERLHGTFRNSDLRYERDQTEISRVLLLPGQKNIRYMVKKYNNVSFIRKELLTVNETETNKYRETNPVEPPRPKIAQKPAPKPTPKAQPKKAFREPILTRSSKK
jgi:hypothetical protein